MEFDLVITDGDIVAEGQVRRRNVGVIAGRIAAISAEPLRGARSYDAKGLLVFPGGVDTHVHFRDPGRTDKEDFATGTRAAITGGFTTVLDIQNNEPFTVDVAAVKEKLSVIGPKARANYAIYGSVGVQNLARLKGMAPYVGAFKAFMTQSVGSLTVTGLGDLTEVFKAARETGRVLAVHSENDAIHLHAKAGLPDEVSSHVLARPPLAEAVAVAECLELVREYRTPINLPHLSTARAVELVRRAKEDGLPVSAATCPHYLLFTADDVAKGGGVFKVNPSIKYASDRDGLLKGLREGVIDHVHSDHAPHTAAEKAQNYAAVPSGIAGIQHQFLVLLGLAAEGKLTYPDVARALAEAPAKAFGLTDVGVLKAGARADFCLVAPDRPTLVARGDLVSKAATSPYIGRTFGSSIVGVVLGGRILIRDGVRTDDGAYGERLEPSISA